MAENRRIEELKRRVKLDPASIAFAALAEEYRRAGRFEEAIHTCRTGLQRHPVYLSARVTLGRSLMEVGRYDEARAELEQVLRTAPDNLTAIRTLAEIHKRLGELDEAASSQSTLVPEPPSARTGPELPPSPAVREPVPIRPVRLSAVVKVEDPGGRPVGAAPSGPDAAPPRAVSTPLSLVPAERRTLAALQSFLAAIQRARASSLPSDGVTRR